METILWVTWLCSSAAIVTAGILGLLIPLPVLGTSGRIILHVLGKATLTIVSTYIVVRAAIYFGSLTTIIATVFLGVPFLLGLPKLLAIWTSRHETRHNMRHEWEQDQQELAAVVAKHAIQHGYASEEDYKRLGLESNPQD
jgi:hypothetical protein